MNFSKLTTCYYFYYPTGIETEGLNFLLLMNENTI